MAKMLFLLGEAWSPNLIQICPSLFISFTSSEDICRHVQTSILTVHLLISQTSPFIYHAHQRLYSSEQLESLMHSFLCVLL